MVIKTRFEYISKLEAYANFKQCHFFLSSIERPNPNEMLLMAYMNEYLRTLHLELKDWENRKRPSL